MICFLTPFAFAQTDEEVKEEIKIEMDELKQEMEKMKDELKVTFENFDMNIQIPEIDLSGLDHLKDMDWRSHTDDEEALAYFESGEFDEMMKNIEIDISKAMEDVQIELKALENIDFEGMNKAIEEAMKDLDIEISKLKKQE